MPPVVRRRFAQHAPCTCALRGRQFSQSIGRGAAVCASDGDAVPNLLDNHARQVLPLPAFRYAARKHQDHEFKHYEPGHDHFSPTSSEPLKKGHQEEAAEQVCARDSRGVEVIVQNRPFVRADEQRQAAASRPWGVPVRLGDLRRSLRV